MLPYYPNPHHFAQEPFYGHIQELNPPILAPPPPPHLSSTLLLPPPTLDYYDPHQILFATQNFASETLEAILHHPMGITPAADMATTPTAVSSQMSSGSTRTRKRPFRTDRHSKIRTAQGVRDRRMRLSLDVAREFFDLQDRLGFDKASQTVDWLLTQSKPAIQRLSASPKHEYNNSVETCSDVISMSSTSELGDLAGNKGKGEQSCKAVASYSLNQMVMSKDAMEMARARARERTVEKMTGRDDDGTMVNANSELDRLVAVALDKQLEGNGMSSNIGVYYDCLGDQMLHNIEEYEADEREADFFDGMQF